MISCALLAGTPLWEWAVSDAGVLSVLPMYVTTMFEPAAMADDRLPGDLEAGRARRAWA